MCYLHTMAANYRNDQRKLEWTENQVELYQRRHEQGPKKQKRSSF